MAHERVTNFPRSVSWAKNLVALLFIFGLVGVLLFSSNSNQLSFASASFQGKSQNNLPKDSYKVRVKSVDVTSKGQALTGQGIVIGIYDGGINVDSASFKSQGVSRIISQSCVGESSEISACDPDPARSANIKCDSTQVGCFHGMAVAGFAAGNNNIVNINSRQVDVSGIAPSANISYVRQAMSAEGEIKYRDFIKALDKFVDDVRTGSPNAPDVINLSLSFPRASYPNCEVQNDVKRAVDFLTSSGVIVVAASGNNSDKTQIAYPACMKNVVAVGSSGISRVDGTDVVSNFSNMSDEIDIVAPGENQVGLMPTENRYVTVSGTSFAAPIVSGAIALMKQANPNLSTQDVIGLFANNSDAVIDPQTQKTYPKLNVQKLFGPQFDALRQSQLGDQGEEGELERAGEPVFGFGSENQNSTNSNSESSLALGSGPPLPAMAIYVVVGTFLVLIFVVTVGIYLSRLKKQRKYDQYVQSHQFIDLGGYRNPNQVIDLTLEDPDRYQDPTRV